MAQSAEKFARLLTDAIHTVSRREAKTVQFVQDDLGYILEKKGGASIEHWRKGHLPPKLSDVETLANQLVTRGGFSREWLENFLRSAGHPASQNLCDKLFPPSFLAQKQPDEPLDSAPLLDALPLNNIPDPAPLPLGSLMPLSRNPLFVGRELDLRALAASLKMKGIAAVSEVKTVATTGLGGIGKTQLACEFVHRYGQFFKGGVFWLSFEDADAIPTKIAACGGPGALDIAPGSWNLPLDDQIRLVQGAWQQPLPRLLIFDNCEDPNLLHKWRPSSGGCRVLVTTRLGDWEAVLGVQPLALGVLLRQESLTLLHHHCPNADPATLDAIAEELGDLPLALHLAGRYLYRYRRVVSPAEYLKRLRDAGLLHHSSLQEGDISPTNHIQHVGRTFALSYDRLNPQNETDDLALALLVRIAHFAPGEPIWYQLLLKTLGRSSDDANAVLKADRAFSRLIELGLIETEQDDILRMHRLVAAFVRDVAKDKVEETQKLVEKVVFEETARVNREGYPVPLLAWQLHLRSVADIARTREDEQSARLCNEMGEHLRQIGDYSSARRYFEKALAIWQKVAGGEHLDTVESLNNLGHLLRDQGNLTEAQLCLENALALRKKVLGESHPKTAESYNEMGRWLYSKGELDAARQHFEQALAISTVALGEDHRFTADYLNNLGMCLDSLGDQNGALQYLERALTIRRKVLGEGHPRTALSFNNMGYILRALGRQPEAQSFYEQALVVRRKVFGEDHPDIAESLNNLGEILQAQGELASAHLYLEQALAVYEKVLGAEHPDAAYTLNNLGILLHTQGDLIRARSYLERALAIRQKALGERHPLTELSRKNLGRLQ